MELTRSRVHRTLVLLERDAYEIYRTVTIDAIIAIARCGRCKRRCRVLPCDVLPRKVYSLAVIEHQVATYSSGEQSLRRVSWNQLGARTPTHTTLHGWTEGLGAYVLGRPGGDLGCVPMSRLVGDAEPRVRGLADMRTCEATPPDPRRYRSEARCERLAAVTAAMALMVVIANTPHPNSMAECRRLSLGWSGVSPLEFPSRLLCSAIELLAQSDPPRSRPPQSRSQDKCPTRTRSPPDASSASHS